ncbi:protein PFC0760c [Parasteatoda tepidariorum]|uniref:protein PFC0760c n=1 Tax=Parasteatoda tepidariorum TaxID=114398 RepID=UPI00077FDFBC|nr:putative leucine-rich repeat-containing protein DDB_G0290503 [Parasteatoda tepidariorum]XP_015921047.1 putative leucine-rich repeat-containing protein DDB_G0290503 [Parasteatoda tepidariorum]
MGDINTETRLRTSKSICSTFEDNHKILKSSPTKRKIGNEFSDSEINTNSSNKKRRSSRLQQNSSLKKKTSNSKKQDKIEFSSRDKLTNEFENNKKSISPHSENAEIRKICEENDMSVQHKAEMTKSFFEAPVIHDVKEVQEVVLNKICTIYDDNCNLNEINVRNNNLVSLKGEKDQITRNVKEKLAEHNTESITEIILVNEKENIDEREKETCKMIKKDTPDLSLTKITELKVIETITEPDTHLNHQNNLNKCNSNIEQNSCKDEVHSRQQINGIVNNSKYKMQVKEKFFSLIENNIASEGNKQIVNDADVLNEVPDDEILQNDSNILPQNETSQINTKLSVSDAAANCNNKLLASILGLVENDFPNFSFSNLDTSISADVNQLAKPNFKKKKNISNRWTVPLKSETVTGNTNSLKKDLRILHMSALDYLEISGNKEATSTSNTNKNHISTHNFTTTSPSELDLEDWKISCKVEEVESSNCGAEINIIPEDIIDENKTNIKAAYFGDDALIKKIEVNGNSQSNTPELESSCVDLGATENQIAECVHNQQQSFDSEENLYINHLNLNEKDVQYDCQTQKHATVTAIYHNDQKKKINKDDSEDNYLNEDGEQIADNSHKDQKKILNTDISVDNNINEDSIKVSNKCQHHHEKNINKDIPDNKNLNEGGEKGTANYQNNQEIIVIRDSESKEVIETLNTLPQIKPNKTTEFSTECNKMNIDLNKQKNITKLNSKEENMMNEITENLKYVNSFTLVTAIDYFNKNSDEELYEKKEICKKFSDLDQNKKTRIIADNNICSDSLFANSQREAKEFRETQMHSFNENPNGNSFESSNANQEKTDISQEKIEVNEKDNHIDNEHFGESAGAKREEFLYETDRTDAKVTGSSTDFDECMNLDDDFSLTASQLSMLEADERSRTCSFNATLSIGIQTDVTSTSYIENNKLLKEVINQLHYLREAVDFIKEKINTS